MNTLPQNILERTQIRFTNKNKFYKELTQELTNHMDIEITKGHPIFEKMLDLIDRHPNRCSAGDDSVFYLYHNIPKTNIEEGRTYTETYRPYMLVNGNYESFSIKKCVMATSSSENANLNQAFRYEIKPFIDHYRELSANRCSLCSREGVQTDIDHCGEYEFKDIVKLFLQTYGRDKTIKIRYVMRLKNEAYRQEWIKFHNDLATLQKVCKTCHKKLTNR